LNFSPNTKSWKTAVICVLPKRPTDINERAKLIVAIATEEVDDPVNEGTEKNPSAVALGRLGGLKGGMARAKKLTASQRKEIAEKAAKKRWGTGKN